MKRWILLADDDQSFRENLRAYIELNFGNDVKIIEAEDGFDANVKIRFQAFDLIITDMNMPKKNGKEFIRSIKACPLNGGTPVIILTGDGDFKYKSEHVRVMYKPFVPDDLTEAVDMQIKLGRTDHRISAELFNNMIGATSLFAKEAFNQDFQTLEPLIKRPGQELPTEHCQHLAVKVGGTVSKFVFELMDDIIPMLESVHVDVPKRVDLQTALVKAVFGHASKKVKDSSFELLKNECVSSGEFSYFTDLAGISMPMGGEKPMVIVHALWLRSQ